MIWNEMLPIGSIVTIKDAEPGLYVMIIGHARIMADSHNYFDYAAVVFPDGYVNNEMVIMFNHEDIDKIYSVGYINEESVEHGKNVKKVSEDVRAGKIDIDGFIANQTDNQ